jgi:hypothetical protein
VPTLLHMVRTGDQDRRLSALAVLRDLAFAPEHRGAIVHAGGIPLLVDTLSSSGQDQAAFYAAACLRSLALNEEWAEKVNPALLFKFWRNSCGRGSIPCDLRIYFLSASQLTGVLL